MRFCKMNGLGNDYIFVYQPEEDEITNPESMAKRLSVRQFSIGADGLVIIDKSPVADFKMRIFNADGTEATMCGNAIRCVAKYVYDRGLITKNEVAIQTLAGIRKLTISPLSGLADTISVDMGIPKMLKLNGHCAVDYSLTTSFGEIIVSPIDMGNPHAVYFTNTIGKTEREIIKEISHSFPDGINAEAARIIDKHNIEMIVYERGSGETLACGTGASAVMFAAFVKGFVAQSVTVHLAGGKLDISYKAGRIFMSGKAEYNFQGEVNI
ncbi:MAG: diaminopimelate epimerase [Clostridia bacterium]